MHSVVWALNSTESQAIGTSPFMLIFGRIPLSPADISLPDPFDTPKSVMDQFLEILARQEVASQHAEAQLKEYQKKMKEYFDKNKATTRTVKEGDIVFVFQPKLKTRKTKKKLQEKFHGPYIVVRFTNPSAVILKNLSNGRTLTKSVNISRLKVGYVRAPVNTWDPLEVDSDEEPLSEDDMPSTSFGDNVTDDTQQPNTQNTQTQPNPQTKQTDYQQQANDARTEPLTPPVTRSRSKTLSPQKDPSNESQNKNKKTKIPLPVKTKTSKQTKKSKSENEKVNNTNSKIPTPIKNKQDNSKKRKTF